MRERTRVCGLDWALLWGTVECVFGIGLSTIHVAMHKRIRLGTKYQTVHSRQQSLTVTVHAIDEIQQAVPAETTITALATIAP